MIGRPTSLEAHSVIYPTLTHVIGALGAGGAERFVIDLIRAQVDRGWRCSLLALSAHHDPTRLRMEEALSSKNIWFAAGPTLRVGARTVAWYGRQLRSLRPAIVHLHTANTDLTHFLSTPWHRNRSLIVRTLHNTQLSLRLLERLAMHALPVAHSIACSEAVRTANLQRMGGPVVTIRNGVRFDWPVRTSTESAAAKRSLGLRTGRTHFLCIARMDGERPSASQKAHDLLIEAWRRAAFGTDEAQLHLLGDGPLRSQLERGAHGLPGISFWGVRPDVPSWLIAADCFVMPSRWEGLPIAGIEAAGTGIPCIFSDIEPLRELGAPAVRLFARGDPDQLARCLRAFHDRPECPSVAAVEAFRREFGIERTAEAYERIYRSISSTAGSAPGNHRDRSLPINP